MSRQLEYVRHFQDLEVYKRQRELSREIFRLTQSFPAEERFSLTDQVRRSSRSIGAQIAEAWAKRLYPRHFVSKLTDADGEQLETQHWLAEAVDCGYFVRDDAEKLTGLCQEIGRMLGSMIRKAGSFASPDYSDSLREDELPYLSHETAKSATDNCLLTPEY
ncbi:four helix bundle protein [bacterium]|nr:four helix bundle protein [bacterium]